MLKGRTGGTYDNRIGVLDLAEEQYKWSDPVLEMDEDSRPSVHKGGKPPKTLPAPTHPHAPTILSGTGEIRFRGVRFQAPNAVSFFGLAEFRGESSVSSSQPIICVPKRTHRVSRRTHRVCRRTQ